MVVYGSLHLADLNHQPWMVPVVQQDWRKIALYRSGKLPTPIPARSSSGLGRWCEGASRAPYLVMDIEGEEAPTIFGMMTPIHSQGYQVFLSQLSPTGRGVLAEQLYALTAMLPFVFHNAAHDLRLLGLPWGHYHRVEDTMVAQAVFQPRFPHSLTFCGSLYGQYQRRDHAKEPGLHNWWQVLTTMDTWEGLHYQYRGDPRWARYEEHRSATVPLAMMDQRINVAKAVDPFWERRKGRDV